MLIFWVSIIFFKAQIQNVQIWKQFDKEATITYLYDFRGIVIKLFYLNHFFSIFEQLYAQITIIQFKVPYQLTQQLKKKAKYLTGTCTRI